MSRKLAGWAGVIAFAVIVGSCNAANNDDDLPATFSSGPSATPTYRSSGAPASTPAGAPSSAGFEAVTVDRVIDGDTVKLRDGRDIRLLGIDSCEIETPGGRDAKAKAEELISASNGQVTLSPEPGVDIDSTGRRHLRYILVSAGDFGEQMVRYDHTGIYDPAKGDAPQAYIDRLYANDTMFSANPPSGRECGQDPPPVEVDNDDDYVPLPDNDDDDDHHRNRGGSVCGRFNPFC